MTILREPFPEQLFVQNSHWHDDDDEMHFFWEAQESADRFAIPEEPQTVAVYKLVGTVTVKANIEVSELEAQ